MPRSTRNRSSITRHANNGTRHAADRSSIGVNNSSSIANGTRHFRARRHGGPDLRSRSGRRWRDLYLGFRADLGRQPTTWEDAQLRQAATLALRCEDMSCEAASGQQINHDDLVRLCGALQRVLRTLGIRVGAGAETEVQQQLRVLEEAGLA